MTATCQTEEALDRVHGATLRPALRRGNVSAEHARELRGQDPRVRSCVDAPLQDLTSNSQKKLVTRGPMGIEQSHARSDQAQRTSTSMLRKSTYDDPDRERDEPEQDGGDCPYPEADAG